MNFGFLIIVIRAHIFHFPWHDVSESERRQVDMSSAVVRPSVRVGRRGGGKTQTRTERRPLSSSSAFLGNRRRATPSKTFFPTKHAFSPVYNYPSSRSTLIPIIARTFPPRNKSHKSWCPFNACAHNLIIMR